MHVSLFIQLKRAWEMYLQFKDTVHVSLNVLPVNQS